jgi:hypothetical protein
MMYRLARIVVVCFGMLLGSVSTVLATGGVALLTAISGSVSPNMNPFSEIPANTSFALADDATVQFLHYVACEEVTVIGGIVVLTQTGYTVEGGKTEPRHLPCRREKVQQAGGKFGLTIWESGAVLLRGETRDQIVEFLKLPPKTVFFVVGDRAKTFSTIRLTRQGVLLAEIPAQTRRFTWPERILEEDGEYKMLFLPKELDKPDARLSFGIAPITTDPPEEAFVLIDFEPTTLH